MKTAVSIPDRVFRQAESLARRLRRSRSQVYADALKEYLARHAPEEITEAVDRVVEEVGGTADDFTQAAARRVLERSEW